MDDPQEDQREQQGNPQNPGGPQQTQGSQPGSGDPNQTQPGNGGQPGSQPNGGSDPSLAEHIEETIHRRIRSRPGVARGGIWAGLFILLVGGVLLMDQMGFPLPDWLFSWHTLLVAIGLFIGLRHNFRGGAWAILMLVGLAFMFQDYYPHAQLHRFIWPCILIFIGLLIMLRPRRPWDEDTEWKREWKREWKHHMHHKWHNDWRQTREDWHQQRQNLKQQRRDWDRRRDWDQRQDWKSNSSTNVGGNTNTGYTAEDFIDSTSIFAGVHKRIVSKNFKGGDIVTILGGSEIDLSQADFTGTARLDVTQIMGGTKIIVPAHWEVRCEVSAVFAGFEDKRQQPAVLNPEKVLLIDGTSIFGGIELKNF